MKRVRNILPFTNKFGDVIQPGDAVYAVTTCSHRTFVSKAEYIGYIEREEYNWRTKETVAKPFVQIKLPFTRAVYFDKLKNRLYKWDGNSEYFYEHVERREEECVRISTLNYNNIIPCNSSIDKLAEAV